MVGPLHPPDPIDVALRAARAFEAAGIPYLIGGSVDDLDVRDLLARALSEAGLEADG